jgi:hypothetical protein
MLLVYTHIYYYSYFDIIRISIIIIRKENYDGLRPVVLIGTPAAKRALRSASIFTSRF